MSQYLGIASWFCCGAAYGGSSVCPIPQGTGKCGTCQNYKYQLAYPYVYYNTVCNKLGCGRTFPRKYCGDNILIQRPCNTDFGAPTIADCGPYMPSFCGNTSNPNDCPGYSGYRDRIVDFTPAAFSDFASLGVGLIKVAINV